MAPTDTPLADQTTELLQKLSLDAQAKPLDNPEPTQKPSVYEHTSVDLGNTENAQTPSPGIFATPLLQNFMDPTMCYIPCGYPSAYYYGGYGIGNEWEYSHYVNPYGVDMNAGIYGVNGSTMYHHGYGYSPYMPYSLVVSPVSTGESDGQLYVPQQYQYTPLQQMNLTNSPFTLNPTAPSYGQLLTSTSTDRNPLPAEVVNSNSNRVVGGGNNGTGEIRSPYPNSFNSNNSYGMTHLVGGAPTFGYQDPRYGFDGFQSPISWLDGSMYPNVQHNPMTSNGMNSSISSRNQNFHLDSNYMGLQQQPGPMPDMGTAHGYRNRMYENKPYGQLDVMDSFHELDKEPRAKGPRNQKDATPITEDSKGENNIPSDGTKVEMEKAYVVPNPELYNREEFPVDYDDAKFFVIKSYSEDDVHKSIKYNVWASTPNGNKKLDATYQEAQQKTGHCPIYLLFSVNGSGQFVGVAEMVGPVDFQKNVKVWQAEYKWTGCFPVKWHIIKDVPNSYLKHIVLENNENKSVTNSRDTQEIEFEKGIKLLKMLKKHPCKTCILDDFISYEVRQKAIQENKANQSQKQHVSEEKHANEKENVATSDGLINGPGFTAHSAGDPKCTEDGSLSKFADADE